MRSIIWSVSLTLGIALGIAYGLRNILGFGETFVLTVIVQLLSFFIYNNWKIEKNRQATEQAENETLRELSKQVVNIKCPCGKNEFDSFIFVNEENIFKCDVCGNDFKVDVNITSVLLTDVPTIETIDERMKSVSMKFAEVAEKA